MPEAILKLQATGSFSSFLFSGLSPSAREHGQSHVVQPDPQSRLPEVGGGGGGDLLPTTKTFVGVGSPLIFLPALREKPGSLKGIIV